jgi:hypothetical protein
MDTLRIVEATYAQHVDFVDRGNALSSSAAWQGGRLATKEAMSMHALSRATIKRTATAWLAVLALALGACHDRNPTVQQPYGPTVPSTSPTSTTPRQAPASGGTILTPARPASTTPTLPSSSRSSS